MLKLGTLILFLKLTLQFARVQSATCNFEVTLDHYACVLNYQIFQNEIDMMAVDGVHLIGYKDENVTMISSMYSVIKVFPSLIINKFKNLQIVSLDNVWMKDFASPITNCKELSSVEINMNEISSIPGEIFRNCAKLNSLNAFNNSITDIHINAFNGTNITNLALTNNMIRSLDPKIFASILSLKSLEISNNQHDEVKEELFLHLQSLMSLSLAGNQIKSITVEIFQNLPNLRKLVLSQNEIETIDFRMRKDNFLTQLQTLELRDNKISSLQDNEFSMLKSLSNLNLQGNQIKSLDRNCIQPITLLRSLDLSFNRIEQIEKELFKDVKNLDFNGEGNVCLNNRFIITQGLNLPDLQNCFNSATAIEVNVKIAIASILIFLIRKL